MVVIEIVKDLVTKEPDKETVAKIVVATQQKGLILLSAGLFSNCRVCALVVTDEQDVLELAIQE